MVYLYTLVSSADVTNIRYVGKTIDPVMRLKQHNKTKTGSRQRTYVNRWIAKEQLSGNTVILNVVSECDELFWQIKEQERIAYYRSLGYKLTNTAIGGEGPTGYKHTDEAKRKISEAGFNRIVSTVTKQKIATARKGMQFSKEHRDALSTASTGKPSTLVKRVISLDDDYNEIEYASVTAAALATKIAASSICAVCNGKRAKAGGYRWFHVMPMPAGIPELMDELRTRFNLVKPQ